MEVFETKICPQCGQELFSDMNVCYGCLHSFEERPFEAASVLAAFPELDEPDELDRPDDDAPPPPRSPTGSLMLRISTGDAQTTVPVPACGLTIGRDVLSDIVLKSRAVSKRHVRVIPLSTAIIVEDMGATNPAMYKGREVRETAVVHAGECFDICGTTVTVVM